ncbi:MAG: MaoC family dehydratase [Alphaproteobacteria bacterium]|nr:MaoC family dehydratase [Alphaproteobacteria bacterium]
MTGEDRKVSFDPASHAMVPQKTFLELRVGDTYALPSRTLGDGNFTAFQALSLDNHPIHYDAEYCRAKGLKAPLAHGLQVLAFTAAGAGLFPHEIGDALMGFVEVRAKFLKGVYPGDTLYPRLTITELKPQRTTGLVTMRASVHNQDGECVLEGEHVYLLKLPSKSVEG